MEFIDDYLIDESRETLDNYFAQMQTGDLGVDNDRIDKLNKDFNKMIEDLNLEKSSITLMQDGNGSKRYLMLLDNNDNMIGTISFNKDRFELKREEAGLLEAAKDSFENIEKDAIDLAGPEIAKTVNDVKKEYACDRAAALNGQKKELINEMADLLGQVRKETSIAKMNGMDPTEVEEINEKNAQIERITISVKEIEDEMPSKLQRIFSSIEKKTDELRETFSRAGDKLKANLLIKEATAKATLKQCRDIVKSANNKFDVGVKTAYAGVAELVADSYRENLAINYAIHKDNQRTYEKTLEKLENRYEKIAAVKEAVKNIGKILNHEDYENAELTNHQKNRLAALNLAIADEKRLSEGFKESFEQSKTKSIEKFNDIQNKRETVGLNRSDSLADRIKEIKEQKIEDAAKKHETFANTINKYHTIPSSSSNERTR